MKTLFRLLVLILFLSGWALAGLSLHVIRTPEHVALVPKDTLGIRDTYVDTRLWTMDDLAQHSSMVQRLVEADKGMLLKHVVDSDDPHLIDSMLNDAIARGAKLETGDTKVNPSKHIADMKEKVDPIWSKMWK